MNNVKRRYIGSAYSGQRQRSRIKLSGSPQRFPQYLEVPLNIEVKPIVPSFSPLLSFSSNPLFSKEDSRLLIFPAVGKSFANIIFA